MPNEFALNRLLAAILFAANAYDTGRKHIDANLRWRPGHPQAQLLAVRILDHCSDHPARRAARQARLPVPL